MFNTLQRQPTQRYDCSEGPYGRSLKRTSVLLQPLQKTKAIAYMDVGEGREQGAEALAADCA